jgi:hypothetical protein
MGIELDFEILVFFFVYLSLSECVSNPIMAWIAVAFVVAAAVVSNNYSTKFHSIPLLHLPHGP